MSESDLNGADVTESNLMGARLDGADLSGADLNFSVTHGLVGGCPLAMTGGYTCREQPAVNGFFIGGGILLNFSGAKLSRADLSYLGFAYTDFRGANLRDADITGASVFNAIFDGDTICPNGDSFPIVFPHCGFLH